MYFEVESTNLKYKIDLERRFSIILGNSGTGKTTLDELVISYTNNDSALDVKITSDLEVVSFSNMGKNVTVLIKDLHDKIIILDEYFLFKTPVFAKAYKTYAVTNNLWFVLMTRETISRAQKSQKDVNTLGMLSYSVFSIYKLVNENGIITNKVYYDYPIYEDINKFDCILVEDTTSGYEFFKAFFRSSKVFSTESGKSDICKTLLDLTNKGYRNILVFVDLAAYGYHMEELDVVFKYRKDISISYVDKYECFEYFLLNTNLVNYVDIVKKVLKEPAKYANQCTSLETYFEKLLVKVTKNKFYHQEHGGNLSMCFINNCDDCNKYKREKCDKVLFGNKFEELLKGTKFETLLNFM